MPTVVITHPRLRGDGPHIEILRRAGFEISIPSPDADVMSPEVLVEVVRDAEAVIAGTEPFNAEVIARLPRLRVIARSGVGYDAIDLAAATAHGIVVTTTPGTNEHSVAEHALAMIVATSRGFPARDLLVRRGLPWRKVSLPRLAGRTLGIVGLGRIGKALAIRTPSLQLKVLACDPFPDHAFAAAHGIEIVTFPELMRRSDIVSLHVPVSDETRGMICRETLAWLKPGAILVNTSRGALVVEEDLRHALASGVLSAAGLDVFEVEPLPPNHPLLQCDHVLLSPHVAGSDTQSTYDSSLMVAEILVELHTGGWPQACVVNMEDRGNWNW